jgi:hypothetical protein
VACPDPGLCASCVHSRTVRGARSTFWRCARADTDPSFARYPTLPVQECRGFEPPASADGAP